MTCTSGGPLRKTCDNIQYNINRYNYNFSSSIVNILIYTFLGFIPITHTHAHTYMHTYVHTYVHIQVHTYLTFVHKHTHIQACTHSRTHTHTHTYTYTHTHIHTHTLHCKIQLQTYDQRNRNPTTWIKLIATCRYWPPLSVFDVHIQK